MTSPVPYEQAHWVFENGYPKIWINPEFTNELKDEISYTIDNPPCIEFLLDLDATEQCTLR